MKIGNDYNKDLRDNRIDEINKRLRVYFLKEYDKDLATNNSSIDIIKKIIEFVEGKNIASISNKGWKFLQSFITVRIYIEKLNNDFPKFFLSKCKELSVCKDRKGAIDVCKSFSSAFDSDSINGFTAQSVSEILHCIQPNYIPILSSRKDIYDVCLESKYGALTNKDDFKYFANNIEILYDFCENNGLPKIDHDGYDFALIDDAIRVNNKNNTGSKNKGEIQNDGGNEMSENNNIEFDKNMILFGPPGTGKTYNTVIYAVAICGGEVKGKDYPGILTQYNELKKSGRIAFTTFHQSYGYEEFIEGIKPVMENGQNSADSNANEDAKETNNEADNKSKDVKYEIKSGVFKSFCDVAKKDPNNSYVFIIDEINRGNISKIFGELITLIEPTKRTGEAEAMEAILPYSNESFGVPKNVYIIGTMNTADRSIALMDTALRRRFQFVEMLPNPEVLKDIKINNTIGVKDLLTNINKRIEYLYDREHTIGHAFFTKLRDNLTIVELGVELGKIFEKSVIPLLQEYFYDDYKKIMLVLGYDPEPKDENTNQNDDQLIIAKKLEKKDIFGNINFDIDIPEYSYEINKRAFNNIESYTKICNENKNNSKQEK